MSLSEALRFAVAGGLSLVLGWASIRDIRSRRIPNWTVLATLALFVVWTLADGGRTLVSSLIAGAIAFVVGLVLYALKVLGAGDSKLFAAVALFAGVEYLPLLVVAVTLTGGVMAIASLASRPQRALVMFALRGKGDWGRGIPYGVAIAAGAAVIVWGGLTHLISPVDLTGQVSAADLSALLRQ